MVRYRRAEIALAVGASSLAGFVDALGFLSLGGFFVSFMSGNSTRLAVGLAGVPAEALLAASLIISFVCGVIIGSIVGSRVHNRRRPVVLALVAIMLAASAGMTAARMDSLALLIVAAAMGAENTTFERDGEVSIGLTYMTGSLVKFGQRMASALTGGPRFAWVPYALLWLGLVSGALLGSAVWAAINLNGLWIASAVAAALAFAAGMIPPHPASLSSDEW